MPLIRRRLELRFEGKGQTVFKVLDSEVKSGKLKLPSTPTMAYNMRGPIQGFDPGTNSTSEKIESRQSLHMPYAKAEEVGITTEVHGIMPYMMSSGNSWSHIMILEKPLSPNSH